MLDDNGCEKFKRIPKKYRTSKKEEDKGDDSDGFDLEYKRVKLNRCVNRLPKVGKKVNLNRYEVYFEVAKIVKPINMPNNCRT